MTNFCTKFLLIKIPSELILIYISSKVSVSTFQLTVDMQTTYYSKPVAIFLHAYIPNFKYQVTMDHQLVKLNAQYNDTYSVQNAVLNYVCTSCFVQIFSLYMRKDLH